MNSILVTGATGSFGRAFVRHHLERGTERICVYSRGEHAQAAMRAELGENERIHYFIGDVRDRDRLRRAMTGIHTVVHAAALKRIETGHYNPIEMVKTNIEGAVNVIEAAIDAGVSKVVALSTDKAYQPVSAYGYSKAMAECLFRQAYHARTLFAVTRYGNVAGSAGSVIPTWRALLRENRPGMGVPVTDPDCTRFWMTMSEAIALVDTTIDTMQGGELRIPVLRAYRLGDLAHAMGATHTIVTGLPRWEKLHESMSDEQCSATARRMTIDELIEALRHV